MKPLEGVKVIEFSTMITASFAAMMLAEQRGLAVYLLKRSEKSLEVMASSAMAQWLEEADSP